MMERWKTETFPDVTWTSNSSTHSAGVLATQLMLLAALPPPSPFPEPLASGHTPVVARQQSLLPPTGPVLADPVALRNHETHAILECLLFPPISLFFAPLKLAWTAAFSFPQTPPTLARASSLPSLVLGPSAKEFRGCATAPVPAQRQNRSPAPPISSQSLVSAAPCVPTLETRSSPLASPLRQPENRTDLVNRLFERGHFGTNNTCLGKSREETLVFFQSRVAVHGVASQSIQLSTRPCRALRPVIPKPTPASAPHRASNRPVRFCCLHQQLRPPESTLLFSNNRTGRRFLVVFRVVAGHLPVILIPLFARTTRSPHATCFRQRSSLAVQVPPQNSAQKVAPP